MAIRPGLKRLPEFKAFHNGVQVGAGWVEYHEIRWNQGEEMHPDVKGYIEAMIRDEMPEEFEKEESFSDDPMTAPVLAF